MAAGYSARVDIDAYVAACERQWARLAELSGRRRLTGAEADELLDLYERVSTHLSHVRSTAPDPALVAHLSGLLARARLRADSSDASTWGDLGRFFTRSFPAALYRMRHWWIAVIVVSLLVATVSTWWLVENPAYIASRLSAAEIEQYVGHDFENYYSEYAQHEFATLVWVNNAWVAAQCIALGALGLPTLWVLLMNVLNLAAAAALMIGEGRADLFFGLILPHGLLELTAVFIAAAVGLRLFWSWIRPGPRSRAEAFAAEGRTAATVALGLVAVLLVSGVIEGFVTPSGLPTWARIAIGVLAEAAFLGYVFVFGRRAALAGETGDLAERDRGATMPVAG